jgi:TonB family protein
VVAVPVIGAGFGCGEPGKETPVVVSAVVPVFPDIAAQAQVSGSLVVEVQLDDSGAVTEARMVDGAAIFRAAGEQAARQWRFRAGEGGARTATLTFVFAIMPKETPDEDLAAVFTLPYQVEVRRRPPALPPVNRDPKPTIVP